MLRTTATRFLVRRSASSTVLRVAAHPVYAPTPSTPSRVRFNSDVPSKEARKAALEARDDLQRDWDAKKLTYDQVKSRSEQPSLHAYIIDVREPDEVIQGSIPSSVNVPLSVLPNSLHLHAAAFQDKHGFQKPQKEQEIVFYCRSGKRSASACDIAKRNGFENIYNYEGSWLDWVEKEGKQSS